MDSQQLRQNLDDVYKKWENKSSAGRYGSSREVGDLGAGGSAANGGPAPGRDAWVRRFGDRPIPTRPPPRSRRRNKQKDEFELLKTSEKQYEVPPPAIPARYKRDRPFMGKGCSSCCTESTGIFYNSDVPNRGVHNILNVAVYNKENLFKRSLCHINFFWNRNVSWSFPKLNKAVTSSARVQNCILNTVFQDNSTKCNVPEGSTAEQIEVLDKTRQKKVAALNKEANGILSIIATQFNRKLFRFTCWVLFKLFGRLLDGIQIHRGQIQMLQRAAQEDKPMVFLPLHKSHLDCVLVTWVLMTCDIKALHVAAGDHLNNILLVSWFMRHHGGFFIKRKLDHTSGKDDLYKSVLQEYVQQLLKEKQYLEIFIEGTRSRTGKTTVPKSGLLSVVVNSVLEDLVPDVLIVPVNISYEKIFETSFHRELLGEPKKPETFWEAVKGIWEVFGTRYGHLRVDFAQPFSLQEFSRSMDCSKVMQEFSSNMAAKSSVTSNTAFSLLRNVSDLSLADMGDDKCFLLTKALGYHVIYDAVQCSAIMSTNILAFLLLHRHREGATLEELAASFKWLRSEVLSRGRDVGFSGNTTDVLQHALQLVAGLVDITPFQADDVMQVTADVTPTPDDATPESDNVIPTSDVTPAPDDVIPASDDIIQAPDGITPASYEVTEPEATQVDVTPRQCVTPKLCIPQIIDLVHYSNLVLSVFALESVVACSIVAVAEENGIQVTDIQQEGTMLQSSILEKATELCEFLQKEFIFLPPCVSMEAGLLDTLDKFITSEIIRCTDQSCSTGTRDQEWAQRFAVSAWDEEEEDDVYTAPEPEYKLSTSRAQLSHLKFLQSLVSPLIESYWVASCGLLWLRDQDFTEGEFLTALHHCAKERVSQDVTFFPESCSLEPLRNAVRIFKEMRVVEVRETSPTKSLLYLVQPYTSEEAIFELIDRIHQFKV